MLKPLLLPKLVEERRRRESMLQENEMDFSPAFRTQNSSASDISPPATPTFSTRGHLRYSSSVSSMEVSLMNTPVTDSPASPIFVGLKRSLPDVQEEPQEREEDFAMLDYTDELYDYFCKSIQNAHIISVSYKSKRLIAIYKATIVNAATVTLPWRNLLYSSFPVQNLIMT